MGRAQLEQAGLRLGEVRGYEDSDFDMTTIASIEAVLGAASTVRGRVSGDGNLRVLGAVEGDVSVRGVLTVAEGGAVRGETVEAGTLVVEGEVTGDISAEGDVTVQAGATLRGAVRGRAVRVLEGATVVADFDAEFDLPSELRD